MCHQLVAVFGNQGLDMQSDEGGLQCGGRETPTDTRRGRDGKARVYGDPPPNVSSAEFSAHLLALGADGWAGFPCQPGKGEREVS